MRHWCTLNFVATGIIFQGAGMSGNEITWVRVDDLTHYAQVGIWKLFVHKKRTDSRKWLAGVHGCRFSEVKLKSGELEEAQWEAVELFYKHLADAAKTLCPSLTAYRHAFPTMKETA